MIGFYARHLQCRRCATPGSCCWSWRRPSPLTVALFITTPKGLFPQDDTGLIMAMTEASPGCLLPGHGGAAAGARRPVQKDPAVAGVGSFIGGGGGWRRLGQPGPALHQPQARERAAAHRRGDQPAAGKTSHIPGISNFMVAGAGSAGRRAQSKGAYQFTLWDSDLDELATWMPKVLARMRKRAGLVDVTSDREQGGLAGECGDRPHRRLALGVGIQAIDDALNDAFGERQISTIYTERNQYRVVLEVAPREQRDPADIARIYVRARRQQVPLSAIAHLERGSAALVVNHQGAFPSITISYNLGARRAARRRPARPCSMPSRQDAPARRPARGVRRRRAIVPAERGRAGHPDAAALLAMYIILGVLYESLIHPSPSSRRCPRPGSARCWRSTSSAWSCR